MTARRMTKPYINRRQVIGGLATSAFASCATHSPSSLNQASYSPPRREDFDPISELPPVDVAYDRVVRTTVGLRPFRASGYRLEAETLGDRMVIHNYGHGGCGVTLSWGCSQRAAKLVSNAKRGQSVAVIGAGALGLTTAHILAEAGARVTIYAADFPPETTSSVSGALWLPSSHFSRNHVTLEKRSEMRTVARESHARFVRLVDEPRYGVYWVRHHDLGWRPYGTGGWLDITGGDDLYPELERSDQDVPYGYKYRQSYFTLMIDPDVFLQALLDDCASMGVEFQARRFSNRSDVLLLDERVIVNCSGFGSRDLFGDPDLVPIRGQLTHLRGQSEIRHSYIATAQGGTLYMFPRQNSIVLGGSHDRGSEELSINEQQVDRMMLGHAAFSAWGRAAA